MALEKNCMEALRLLEEKALCSATLSVKVNCGLSHRWKLRRCLIVPTLTKEIEGLTLTYAFHCLGEGSKLLFKAELQHSCLARCPHTPSCWKLRISKTGINHGARGVRFKSHLLLRDHFCHEDCVYLRPANESSQPSRLELEKVLSMIMRARCPQRLPLGISLKTRILNTYLSEVEEEDLEKSDLKEGKEMCSICLIRTATVDFRHQTRGSADIEHRCCCQSCAISVLNAPAPSCPICRQTIIAAVFRHQKGTTLVFVTIDRKSLER